MDNADLIAEGKLRGGLEQQLADALEQAEAQRFADIKLAQRLIDAAERERDLAIAHDTQPYPTAWAYEQASKALAATRAVLAEIHAAADECDSSAKFDRLVFAAEVFRILAKAQATRPN